MIQLPGRAINSAVEMDDDTEGYQIIPNLKCVRLDCATPVNEKYRRTYANNEDNGTRDRNEDSIFHNDSPTGAPTQSELEQ
jgi:hypothetical protein